MAVLRLIDDPEAWTRPIVLIVDDVVLVRMLLADYLRGAGFHVVETSNGEEAIRVLDAGCPARIVISDVHMPGAIMDGLDLARWINRHRPEIKVILASGLYTALDPADAHFHEGPLLQKPFKPQEVARRLRLVLGEASPTPLHPDLHAD
jgi:CheY-like chemotaxis protein